MNETIRRNATLTEAKSLPITDKIVPGSRPGFFILWSQAGTDGRKAAQQLVKMGRDFGFKVEILSVFTGPLGEEMVQFWMTHHPQDFPNTTINNDVVESDGHVLSNPANLGLPAWQLRVPVMAKFMVDADRFMARSLFAKKEQAFIDRLFKEGLLERDPVDLNRLRPTSGGKAWFAAKDVELAA